MKDVQRPNLISGDENYTDGINSRQDAGPLPLFPSTPVSDRPSRKPRGAPPPQRAGVMGQWSPKSSPPQGAGVIGVVEPQKLPPQGAGVIGVVEPL